MLERYSKLNNKYPFSPERKCYLAALYHQELFVKNSEISQ